METSPIYELLPGFKERNNVIFMLLGLLSTSEDWMRLLESHAERYRLYETPQNYDDADEAETEPADDRGFLYFLLGTISFTDHFKGALSGARLKDQTSTPPDLTYTAWEDLPGLLR